MTCVSRVSMLLTHSALRCPTVKGLLRQITGFFRPATQTKGKPIKAGIIIFNKFLEIQIVHSVLRDLLMRFIPTYPFLTILMYF